MTVQLQCVVLDCPDPMELARFYAALLDGELNRPDRRWGLDEDWATVHLGAGPVLAFQRVSDYQPPAWPDPHRPQQFHLDFGVAESAPAQERVLSLGGRLLDEGPAARGWRVYADPAGHPFCLVRE